MAESEIVEALLPCPFCGTAARLQEEVRDSCNAFVYCPNEECDAIGPQYRLTEPEAIAAWNRRSPPNHNKEAGG